MVRYGQVVRSAKVHEEDDIEGRDEGIDRVLAFSDGVFAIAITLLVLNLNVPKVSHDLLHALGTLWPAYLSYVLSFSIIGIVWASHHHMFRNIKRSDHPFLLINILFLMWVAIIPFPTNLLAHYLGTSQDHPAMAIYAITFWVGSLLFNFVWWYATHERRLLAGHVESTVVERTNQSFRVGLILYLVDFVLAFEYVAASLALFIAIAAFYAMYPLLVFHTRPSES